MNRSKIVANALAVALMVVWGVIFWLAWVATP
jgi:hypothetical protein